MTIEKKKEALSNSLETFGFNKKYFIQTADARLGHKFAIAHNTESGGVFIHTGFMSYECMNQYLMGYNKALTNPLN